MKETGYLTDLIKKNEHIPLKVRVEAILKMFPRLK